MKIEAAIVGFFFLALVSVWACTFAFSLLNQPSNELVAGGTLILAVLILLWAYLLKKATGENLAKRIQAFFEEGNEPNTRGNAGAARGTTSAEAPEAGASKEKHDGN